MVVTVVVSVVENDAVVDGDVVGELVAVVVVVTVVVGVLDIVLVAVDVTVAVTVVVPVVVCDVVGVLKAHFPKLPSINDPIASETTATKRAHTLAPISMKPPIPHSKAPSTLPREYLSTTVLTALFACKHSTRLPDCI